MNDGIHKHKRIRIILITLAVVLLVAGLLVYCLYTSYIYCSGKMIPRTATDLALAGEKVCVSELLKLVSPEHINLEGCDIKVSDYDLLKGRFPDCNIKWSIPLSSGSFSNDSTAITLTAVSESDFPLFKYFDDLEKVDAEGVAEWQLLSALEKQYPDIDVNWGITLNGRYYSSDIERLVLNGSISYPELNEKLSGFTDIKSVSLLEDDLSTDEKLSLQSSYPDISFCFAVKEFGEQFSNLTDRLDLAGKVIDIDRLVRISPLFKNVRSIDFTGCSYSNDEMLKVMQAFPDADVCWQFKLYGVEVSSLDEEIDFSGIQIDDIAEMEDVLPLLKHLQKVIMCKCGVSDEEMDALNKRYDTIRFIWTVYLGSPKSNKNPRFELRTDTTYFISSLQIGEENAYMLYDDTAEPLKYCTDMVALDLSHNRITNCEFCRYMPKLRYFIAPDCPLNDISPLAECKELFYLELMFCPVTDLSPLLECKELRHLNVCACPTQDSVRPVLSQMTWLERCYMAGRTCYYPSDRNYVYSDEFLPATEKWLLGLEFYYKWRRHPAYREMRDALGGAYYMDQ